MGIPHENITKDKRDLPAYSVGEACRYLCIPPRTLKSWLVGRSYPVPTRRRDFQPLITPAGRDAPVQLSFNNLIEAHVLRALRTRHGISIQAAREAMAVAEKEYAMPHLLLSKKIMTGAGELFLERYGMLIHLDNSGQIALRRLLHDHLKRIEWDNRLFPSRLYPILRNSESRTVVIDARIAFGRPVIERRGIGTAIIVERINAGESVEDVALDYDLQPYEVEDAILYEQAA